MFLGTHQDNVDDMIRKGRQDFSHLHTGPWIENLPRRLSPELQAEVVRLRVEERLKLTEVGAIFGVSDKYVSALCRKRHKDLQRFRAGE